MSYAAENAIQYAAQFARKTRAELVLLNVQSVFSLPVEQAVTAGTASREELQHGLDQRAREISEDYDISCLAEVRFSDNSLSDVIADQATSYELIIMGTSGPDDLYSFFFGTNTYQVLKKSGVPLLFIPETVKFTEPDRIIFAYDYLHLGTPPLKQFRTWIHPFDAEIRFLQLIRRPLNEEERVVLSRHQTEITYELNDDFQVTFDQDVSSEFHDSIQHYMLKSDAGMLVICSRPYTLAQKLFHKSLAKRIAMDFMYPSLVVHDEAL